jgi:hypothetical protein
LILNRDVTEVYHTHQDSLKTGRSDPEIRGFQQALLSHVGDRVRCVDQLFILAIADYGRIDVLYDQLALLSLPDEPSH